MDSEQIASGVSGERVSVLWLVCRSEVPCEACQSIHDMWCLMSDSRVFERPLRLVHQRPATETNAVGHRCGVDGQLRRDRRKEQATPQPRPAQLQVS